MSQKYISKVGIDVGGTFTDLFSYDDDSRQSMISKVPSTPDDFTIGVLRAISDAAINIKHIDYLIHGSTIATNSAIERTYPIAPLITTRGFRDFTLIGRYHRKSLYNPYQKKPEALVRRRNVFEVSERINSSGHIIETLNVEEAEAISEKFKVLGATSVAVCFLNSYANNIHEEEMKKILQGMNPDIFVSLSSTIPKFRALGRFSAAILRACLQPVVQKYFKGLNERLIQEGFRGRLLIVTNNGGMIDAEIAIHRPELMLTSGPASGVNAALFISECLGKKKLITMDMGGTSADVSIIENGQPLVTSEYELDLDIPVYVPMLDIRSIGAGGGSIAWIDEGGSIRVGPRSSGSFPGPACYGKGGTNPTVTDANLILGRISHRRIFGKEISLDFEASKKAIKTLADQIGLDLITAASGIITIVNENMAASLKQISLERGRDPRDFCLVAFGGAGPMHAVFLATTMGIHQIIIPPDSGVFSAFGGVVMDFRNDFEKTFYFPIQEVNLEVLNKQYQELERKGFDTMLEQKVSEEKVEIFRSAQMRYIGQTYEVETPVPSGEIGPDELETIASNFHNEHEKEYGLAGANFSIAFVNLRSTVFGKVARPRFDPTNNEETPTDQGLIERRDVFFDDYGFIGTAVFDRLLLKSGFRFNGPAIVEDISSTTIIAPEMTGDVDGYGNIIINING